MSVWEHESEAVYDRVKFQVLGYKDTSINETVYFAQVEIDGMRVNSSVYPDVELATRAGRDVVIAVRTAFYHAYDIALRGVRLEMSRLLEARS